ncbi:hypothetical protein VCRA2119O147_1090002 [Vibrio crassostreae]|nr:hypothetical protein VCRA2119O147_1090002 [Vibrio crassostreae]CAK2968512.1 hypothetical protein VCRA2110O183_500002 [Vibrio crassostreae]CAK3002863.1 hypothetical protein VCRA2121O264_480001 [Vibrio crassostreae]CAK3713077.1 hypothetical protein VCRA2121O262_500012 [Vibrio crassostreae]
MDNGCDEQSPAPDFTREPAGHDYHPASLVSDTQAQIL